MWPVTALLYTIATSSRRRNALLTMVMIYKMHAMQTRQTHHKVGPLPKLAAVGMPSEAAIAVDDAQPKDLEVEPVTTPATLQAPPVCRSPMFARRAPIPATNQRAESPVTGQASGTVAPPIAADRAPDKPEQAVDTAPFLPPNIVVDVEAEHRDATARLEQAEAEAANAAAVAAAKAAAAAVAVVSDLAGSRPVTRQGLSEVLATVGAALESAATQMLARSGSMDRSGEQMQPAIVMGAEQRTELPLDACVLLTGQQQPLSPPQVVDDDQHRTCTQSF